ncbi:MAG: nucleotidyltransferase domain-containing protein [Dehalococcoidia bacterium]|nr:nucleotidyltransferase domain-containing protein [Dehalococcoidia bacterium]
MSDRLRLPSRYRQQVEDILRENMPQVEAWAYGSRVNGESHEASDLDLALRAPGLRPIPGVDMEALREAFRESNIPIIVDARDWSKLPESFHEEIERDYVSLNGN